MTVICPQHNKQELSEEEVIKQIAKERSPIMHWFCPVCKDLANVDESE